MSLFVDAGCFQRCGRLWLRAAHGDCPGGGQESRASRAEEFSACESHHGTQLPRNVAREVMGGWCGLAGADWRAHGADLDVARI